MDWVRAGLLPAKHPLLLNIQHLPADSFHQDVPQKFPHHPVLAPSPSLLQALLQPGFLYPNNWQTQNCVGFSPPREPQWIPPSRSGSDCLNGGAGFRNRVIGGDLLFMQYYFAIRISCKTFTIIDFKAVGWINNQQCLQFSVDIEVINHTGMSQKRSETRGRCEMMHESGCWQN